MEVYWSVGKTLIVHRASGDVSELILIRKRVHHGSSHNQVEHCD